MIDYTTCADCGDLLHVTEYGQTVHPGCTPRPTRFERLCADYVAAAQMGDQPELEATLAAEIDAVESAPPRLLDAALTYASWGWGVFPLMPLARALQIYESTGEPFDKIAKRPVTTHGCLDATEDAGRIRSWWERHPDSNIGLATGGLFDVIDIDPRHGGTESLARILAAECNGEGAIPHTHGRAMTAGGGWHYYIEPLGVANSANTLMPGIDARGKGGYVVAPPSWLGHQSRRWAWATKPSPKIRRPA